MIHHLQDQYNFLDTPRTVVDWNDMNGHDDLSVECLSQNSDEADTSEENEDKDVNTCDSLEANSGDVDLDVNIAVQDSQTSGDMSSSDTCCKDELPPENEIFCNNNGDTATSSDEVASTLSPIPEPSVEEKIECAVDNPTNIPESNTVSQAKDMDAVDTFVDAMMVDNGELYLSVAMS